MENKEGTKNKNDAFDLRAFSGDVAIFSLGNILLLVFGFIHTLIIPKYLSVEGYGYWQLFMLYGSYGGILHLGFIDGILVRWAGKKLPEIGSEIHIAFKFLLLELVGIIVPLSLFLYFLLDPPFRWIGLMIVAYAFILDLVTFFRFTSQAITKFKFLTTVNVSRGALFLIGVVILFISGYLNYYYVILTFLVSHIFALFIFILWFRKYLWNKNPVISFSSLKSYGIRNIAIGVFVLLGNFIAALFLTLDRLMVNFFFSLEEFAVYAFALAIAMVAYTFVGTASQVFFPYLSALTSDLQIRTYQLAKPALILTWAAILTLYFPLTEFIKFYLPKYVASLPIMQILICTVGFGSLVQVLHINYYKAFRRQQWYFFWGMTALILSGILNFSAIMIFGTLESVAIATLLSFGIWYVLNELSLKTVTGETSKKISRYLLIICGYLGIFWLPFLLTDWFLTQMLIYIGLFSVFTWFFLRLETRQLIAIVNGLRNR